jgi:hypothetical protein
MSPCIDENFSHCNNHAYVKPWKVLKIKPHSVDYAVSQLLLVDGEDSWDYEYYGEAMADLVRPGDNFIVPAALDNDVGIAFYILQCQSPKHVVQENFQYNWGGEIEVDDCVVSRTYYQK